MTARYAPGRATAIVGARALVVMDAELAPAAITAIWQGLDAADDLATVLGLVAEASGTGLTNLPDFAIALAERDGIRVALRGGLTAQAAGPETVSGAGVSTWVERLLPGAASVTVVAGASGDDVSLPLGTGVVLASRIEWAASGALAPAQPVPEPVERRPSTPPADDASAGAASIARAAATGMIDSAAVLSAAAAQHDTADTLLPVDTGMIPDPPQSSPWQEPTALAGGPADAEEDESAQPDASGYDHLWGATIVRSIEDAAVRPDEDQGEEAPAAPPTLDDGDHDGATISIAQARALRAERGSPPPLHGSLARSAEPPEAWAQPPQPLAPPRLPAPARIRLSTGQVLNLDRTVVIGRRPRSTRVSGTDLPHLVAVESPQQDISRSHLELRVDAGAIVATDLHTTNGSMLLRPGSDPVRLHPGESTVVVVGDVVDLGDGVTVTIEALS